MSVRSIVRQILPPSVRSLVLQIIPPSVRRIVPDGVRRTPPLTWSVPGALVSANVAAREPATNRLATFFEQRKTGPGIFKWRQYFDAYERHFHPFVGREAHVLEIGVYSGGSIDMWRDYFGPRAHLYGIDIEPVCKSYEKDRTRIFIGDQADRAFWREFRHQVPQIDILIDDGGHTAEQQITTLEEMLPHLSMGGVYLCEDLHSESHFGELAARLANRLNSFALLNGTTNVAAQADNIQSAIHSVHFYPFAIVIEKNQSPIECFTAPKHGTEWQAFL